MHTVSCFRWQTEDDLICNELVIAHTYQLLAQSSAWDHLSEGRGCFCFSPLESEININNNEQVGLFLKCNIVKSYIYIYIYK